MSAPAQQVDVEVRLLDRDGHTSDKLAVPGTLSAAQNVEMTREGRYQRRPGSVDHSNLFSTGHDIESLDDELVDVLSFGVFAYNEVTADWESRGNTPHRSARVEPRVTSSNQTSHSLVIAGGYDWDFWIDNGLAGGTAPCVRYSVIDRATGQFLYANRVLDGTTTMVSCAAFVVGVNIFVLMMDSASTATSTLKARNIPIATPDTPSASSTIDVTTVAGAAKRAFDAYVRDASVICIAYKFDSGGTSRLRVRNWTVSTMTSAAVNTFTSATQGDDAIGIMDHLHTVDSLLHIALAGPTGLSSMRINATSLAFSGTEAVLDATFIGRACTGWVDSVTLTETVHAAEYSVGVPASPIAMSVFTRTSGGVVSLAAGPFLNISPASRPWYHPTHGNEMLFKYHSDIQPTYFVASPFVGLMAAYARIFSGTADAYTNPVAGPLTVKQRFERLPVAVVDGTEVILPLSRLEPNSTPKAPVTGAYKVTLGAAEPAKNVVVPGGLLIPGGAPLRYDHSTVSGWFHLAPETPVATAVAGTLAAGVYRFIAIYEITDPTGRVHRSAQTPEVSITLGAPGGVQLSTIVTGLLFHNYGNFNDAAVSVSWYRTDVNPGVAPQFYFRGRADGIAVFVDNDINRVSGEELYVGDGSTFENGPPPPLRQYENWNGRGFYLLEENRRAFGWTKRYQEGVGVEFTENFTGLIEDKYGDLTALAPLGERFILFKRDAFYWISGDGPDDQGNGDFTEPALIEGFPGTLNPRSVLSTELGVFYQAPDMSIWLMGFGLSCTKIMAVDDVRMPVVDAILVSDRRQARFYVASGGFGLTLVYDLDHRRWFTWTDADSTAPVSACVHDGVAHVATSLDTLRVDEAAAWTDAGVPYLAAIELTWMSLGKLAGYCRTWAIQLLGELLGAHTLSLLATADFGTTPTTRSLASTAIQSAHGYRVEAKVPRQMQQETSLKLQIRDNSPATAGWALDAINLQVGIAAGRRPRLPRGHRMG